MSRYSPPTEIERYAIEGVIAEESASSGLTRRQIMSHRRMRDWVTARHAVWYKCDAMSIPITHIAHFFNRDHGTVRHGIDKVFFEQYLYPNAEAA